MFDTHAHLNLKEFREDGEAVIARAGEKNFRLIVCGVQQSTSRRAVELSTRYENIYAAVGLHPEQLREQTLTTRVDETETVTFTTRAEDFDPTVYRELARSSPKVVAIGEIGLDFYRLPENGRAEIIERQKETLIAQIALANELNLPAIIHTRECDEAIVELLSAYPVRAGAVLHSFLGSVATAEKILALGYYLGFNGVITFKNAPAAILDLIKTMPAEKILVETDCPYLTPEPFRGRRNEPIYAEYVLKKIAALRRWELAESEKITDANAMRLFKISQ